MAGFETPLVLKSKNALEIIDLAYVRPGRKIEFPRLRQIDDRAAPVQFMVNGHEDPNVSDAAAKTLNDLESHIKLAVATLQKVRSQVDVIIKNDLLAASGMSSLSQSQTILFKGKTAVAGAMLRVVCLYDSVLSDILSLKNSGCFLGTNQDVRLMKAAGSPVRRMMHDVNVELLEFTKQLEGRGI